jgi:uncharacterized protein YndB with AHSA1/START domain
MANPNAALEAVRKTLTVDCSVEHAFSVFTDGIGSWWPLHSHSISVMEDGSGAPETVIMEAREGGRLYERTADGQECDWGTVKTWQPPHRLVLEWAVNRSVPATEVEVVFSPEGRGTLVELEHRGFERYPADARSSARTAYTSGWDSVLAAYSESVGEKQ